MTPPASNSPLHSQGVDPLARIGKDLGVTPKSGLIAKVNIHFWATMSSRSGAALSGLLSSKRPEVRGAVMLLGSFLSLAMVATPLGAGLFALKEWRRQRSGESINERVLVGELKRQGQKDHRTHQTAIEALRSRESGPSQTKASISTSSASSKEKAALSQKQETVIITIAAEAEEAPPPLHVALTAQEQAALEQAGFDQKKLQHAVLVAVRELKIKLPVGSDAPASITELRIMLALVRMYNSTAANEQKRAKLLALVDGKNLFQAQQALVGHSDQLFFERHLAPDAHPAAGNTQFLPADKALELPPAKDYPITKDDKGSLVEFDEQVRGKVIMGRDRDKNITVKKIYQGQRDGMEVAIAPSVNKTYRVEDGFMAGSFTVDRTSAKESYQMASVLDGHGGTAVVEKMSESYSRLIMESLKDHEEVAEAVRAADEKFAVGIQGHQLDPLLRERKEGAYTESSSQVVGTTKGMTLIKEREDYDEFYFVDQGDSPAMVDMTEEQYSTFEELNKELPYFQDIAQTKTEIQHKVGQEVTSRTFALFPSRHVTASSAEESWFWRGNSQGKKGDRDEFVTEKDGEIVNSRSEVAHTFDINARNGLQAGPYRTPIITRLLLPKGVGHFRFTDGATHKLTVAQFAEAYGAEGVEGVIKAARRLGDNDDITFVGRPLKTQ